MDIVPADEGNELQLFTSADATIERFLAELDVQDNSRAVYRRALHHFFSWLTDQGITRPRRQDITRYREYLAAAGFTPATVNGYLTPVRGTFAYLQAEGIYPNITSAVKGLRQPKGFLKGYLTADQIERLLDGISFADLKGRRDYALINVMVGTGLRTISISLASVGDIVNRGGELTLRYQGKGSRSKDDFVLLLPDVYGPIADYLAARGATSSSDPLFACCGNRNHDGRLSTRAIRHTVERRLTDAGLKTDTITTHSLRHTAATLALQEGADILQVKDMLGHADLNSTLHYSHNIQRIADGAERRVAPLLRDIYQRKQTEPIA